MNRRTLVLLGVLLLAVLLKASFWADQRSLESQAVVRMVVHPDGSLFLLTNDGIIHASPDGDVLSDWPLARMGITEPVADISFGLDGQVLVGLVESQEIRRYSAGGEFVGTVARMPSTERVGVPGQYLRNFKFARDQSTGTLYVADSNHHRIQIYPVDSPDVRVLTAPDPAARSAASEGGPAPAGGEQANDLDPALPFEFPNALAVDGDRLYATDTNNHRIVVFRLDGSLDRIIPTVPRTGTPNIYPVHFARRGDTLFVVNRGTLFVGGEVDAIDLASRSLLSRPVFPSGLAMDPLDIAVVNDDLLIADGVSRNILRYAPEGYYLGFFGKPPLQAILRAKARTYHTYLFLRMAAIGGMMLVLILFLVLKRTERLERAEQGLPDVHRPLPTVQGLIGPAGSARRTWTLALLPGIGQIAAGRLLRAIVLLPPLLLLLILFLASLVLWLMRGVTALPAVMVVGIVTAAYWSGVALDGLRLNEAGPRRARTMDPLAVLKAAGLALITVAAGAASQITWEYAKRVFPALPLALRGAAGRTMLSWGLSNAYTVPFDAAMVVGMLAGWGGAAAGMFGVLAWRLGRGRNGVACSAAVGGTLGVLFWSFSAAVPGSMLGGAYYLPLSQGALMGLAVYALFRGPLVTWLVVPLSVAAAWIGNLLHLLLFLRFDLPFLPPGAAVRTIAVVFEAYCIHVAVLLLILSRENRAGTP